MSKPIAKYRSGSVSCAVWQNDSGMESVTFQHSYKDKNTNEWENTNFIPEFAFPNLLAIVNRLAFKSVLTGDSRKPTQTHQQEPTIPSATAQVSKTENVAPEDDDSEQLPF